MRPTLTLLPSPSLAERIHADERMEMAVVRAELLTHTQRSRSHLRAAMKHMAAGRLAAAATEMLAADALNEQAARRAVAMELRECPCGQTGSGHGPGDSAEMAA